MATQAGRRYVESFDRAHRATDFFLINGLADEAAEAVAAIEDEVGVSGEARIAQLQIAGEQLRLSGQAYRETASPETENDFRTALIAWDRALESAQAPETLVAAQAKIAQLEEALELARDPFFEPHGPIVRKWWRLGWLSCRAVLADVLAPESPSSDPEGALPMKFWA